MAEMPCVLPVHNLRWEGILSLHSTALFADIDECAVLNGGCSHRCVNSPGGHRCECPPGMQVNSGGRKCVGECDCITACEQWAFRTSQNFRGMINIMESGHVCRENLKVSCHAGKVRICCELLVSFLAMMFFSIVLILKNCCGGWNCCESAWCNS